MPKDNFDTAPDIVRLRKTGSVARLNMELATTQRQTVPQNLGTTSGTGGAVASDIQNRTGGFTGGGRVPCFTGDTLVGAKRIDELVIGDLVPAFDPETREISETVVTKTMLHETVQYLRMTFEDGRHLKVTPEHLLYDGESFRAAGSFAVAGHLFDTALRPVRIEAIEEVIAAEPVLVYNLETEIHTYFAGGFAVHNAKAPGDL